jgi:hypothetical protein
VEVDYNISTVALKVVNGDENGSKCMGVKLCQLVTGGYKYRDLVPQVVSWTQG